VAPTRRGKPGTAPRVLLAGLALLLCAGAAASDDAGDAAWRGRLDRHLEKLEEVAADVDGQKPSGKTLVERTVALDARVRALEQAAGLSAGAIRGDPDLSLLTLDLTMLQTRLNAVIAARAPKKPQPVELPADVPKAADSPKPAPDPDAPDAKDKADKKSAASKWPQSVRFLATAKFVFGETGEWYEVLDGQGLVIRRDFLMDGRRGTLGLSLRAANLKTDVRAAVVRVRVRMQDPYVTADSAYHDVDIRWEASNQVFGNDSLKSFPAHEVLSVRGPIRWISGPRTRSMPVSAEAWLLAATLASGEELTFEEPKAGK
jgi:hypothetical protein